MQLPTLQTSRLILRPPVREDFEAFAAFMADERTARYVGGVLPRSLAWRQFAAVAGSWMLNGYSMFTVIEKSTGAWIGRSGPWMSEGWPG
jgi:RimJ/RimL family protein N-acetyltransferase